MRFVARMALVAELAVMPAQVWGFRDPELLGHISPLREAPHPAHWRMPLAKSAEPGHGRDVASARPPWSPGAQVLARRWPAKNQTRAPQRPVFGSSLAVFGPSGTQAALGRLRSGRPALVRPHTRQPRYARARPRRPRRRIQPGHAARQRSQSNRTRHRPPATVRRRGGRRAVLRHPSPLDHLRTSTSSRFRTRPPRYGVRKSVPSGSDCRPAGAESTTP